MTFIAEYRNRKNRSKEAPPYWCTIYADTLNEAIKRAEKYTKKNYTMITVIQKELNA